MNLAELEKRAVCAAALGGATVCIHWEELLRLVSIAKAAEKALPVFDEAVSYVDVPTFSPSMAVECNDALAALRAALSPLTEKEKE